MKPRKLHIDGNEWRYVVGKRAAVVWSPGGERRVVSLEALTGRIQEDIDKGRADGARRPHVPSAKRRAFAAAHGAEKEPFRKRKWYGPNFGGSDIVLGMIRPWDVKAWIETAWLGKPSPSTSPKLLCGCLTDVGVEMMPDPFASEIDGDDTPYPLCHDCTERSAMDI